MTDAIRRYPFSAVVGQQPLKLALKLAAINPALGGVLVSGPKGSAKSTLSRALADIIGSGVAQNSESNPTDGTAVKSRPFIHLPLGTTEEMLVGTLDIERVLQDRQAQFRPGILAKADGGILYVDEVNLLADHLVDQLLDVATSGINTVERDGISHSHGAKFILLGTMNPDEGELRPQLLDRFGLAVAIEQRLSIAERIEVVKRREQFDQDPEQFNQQYHVAEQQLKQAIQSASDQLVRVQCSDAMRLIIAERCYQAQVDGLRADIVWLQAAKAHAALRQVEQIELTDIDAVEDLVLGHRRMDGGGSSSHNSGSGESADQAEDQPTGQANQASAASSLSTDQKPSSPYTRPPESRRDQAAGADSANKQKKNELNQTPQLSDCDNSQPFNDDFGQDVSGKGDSGKGESGRVVCGKGDYGKSDYGKSDWGSLPAPALQAIKLQPLGQRLEPLKQQLTAWMEQGGQRATAKSSQPSEKTAYQGDKNPHSILSSAESRRVNWFTSIIDNMGRWPLTQLSFYRQPSSINQIHLVLLDTSASVLKQQMLNAAQNLLQELSQQIYLKRQRLLIIGFGNQQTNTLLPLQRAPKLLDQQWSELLGGGGTPLELALTDAAQQQQALMQRLPNVQFSNYLLTDGRIRQLPSQANLVGRTLVIDMEQGAVKRGRGAQLAQLFQADYLPLNLPNAL